MKFKEPEILNSRTPQWFKDWHSKAYWHCQYSIETKLANHDRMLWIILGAIIVATVTNIFV